MFEKLPNSIIKLADNNQKALRELEVSRNDLLTSFDKTQRVGLIYLTRAFIQHNIDDTPDGIMSRNGLMDTPMEKQGIISELMNFDPAMIVVRPEMYHLTDQICDFLKNNDFNINYTNSKVITITEYFSLYQEVIRNVAPLKPALPSRTLTYTNAESSIIIFTDPTHRFKDLEISLADGFFKTYKGVEAKPEKNTIRGELILNEGLKLGYNTLSNPVVAEATDPFGAYTQIIKQPGNNWYHLKTSSDLYMMMYNGQGIHFPNSKEIYKDIATLHDVETLKHIVELTKNSYDFRS